MKSKTTLSFLCLLVFTSTTYASAIDRARIAAESTYELNSPIEIQQFLLNSPDMKTKISVYMMANGYQRVSHVSLTLNHQKVRAGQYQCGINGNIEFDDKNSTGIKGVEPSLCHIFVNKISVSDVFPVDPRYIFKRLSLQ